MIFRRRRSPKHFNLALTLPFKPMIMKTNKIALYLLSALLIFTAASCKKFLAVEPLNSVSDAVTIVDKSSGRNCRKGHVPGISQ